MKVLKHRIRFSWWLLLFLLWFVWIVAYSVHKGDSWIEPLIIVVVTAGPFVCGYMHRGEG